MFSFILYGGLIRELIMQTCLVSSHQLLLFPLFLTDGVLLIAKQQSLCWTATIVNAKMYHNRASREQSALTRPMKKVFKKLHRPSLALF